MHRFALLYDESLLKDAPYNLRRHRFRAPAHEDAEKRLLSARVHEFPRAPPVCTVTPLEQDPRAGLAHVWHAEHALEHVVSLLRRERAFSIWHVTEELVEILCVVTKATHDENL